MIVCICVRSDGSHRTLSCAPDTTCGELVDQLLEKLGLGAQRNEHSLQIKYQFSGERTTLVNTWRVLSIMLLQSPTSASSSPDVINTYTTRPIIY